MKRRHWIALAVLLCVLFACAIAFARPGGGQSYSGGGSGGGGGGDGGGDDGGLIFALIWLCIEHPAIGFPILFIVIIVSIVRAVMKSQKQAWSTSAAAVPQVQQVQRSAAYVPRAKLDQIRSLDPEFSNILFEDFIYTLYAEIQRARGATGNPAALSAFVSPHVLQYLRTDANLGEVRGIVIGAMRVIRFSGVQAQTLSIELEFEANYSEAYRQGGERRFYVVDRMTLSRARSAKSRPAGRSRTLDCPNCGAPIQSVRGTQCTYCRQEVGGGRFDWNVDGLRTLSKEMRGPLLTSNVEEVGTNYPTIVDPGAQMRMGQIQQRDPALNWNTFQARVNFIFHSLQQAWGGRDGSRIRPFVTDNLFQSMMYWIDLYVMNRCRNVNENARILRIDLANVLSDRTYDAITVRVFATGLDYTIGDDGRMLSGSRSKERTYSEYWTLVRGVNPKGTKGDQNCPSCGAPLKISQVGNCEYCKVKVTTGEFDWVLSRIEQDESYTG